MFIFGGRSGSHAKPPQLIAVDLEEEAWWVVQIEGGPVLSRMSCCMVGEQDRLYIFGGSDPYDDNASFLSSFSVAEFMDGKWKWTARDQAYPAHVPCLGFSGQATSVYDGKKILLTMGRLENDAVCFMFCHDETIPSFHLTVHKFLERHHGIVSYHTSYFSGTDRYLRSVSSRRFLVRTSLFTTAALTFATQTSCSCSHFCSFIPSPHFRKNDTHFDFDFRSWYEVYSTVCHNLCVDKPRRSPHS